MGKTALPSAEDLFDGIDKPGVLKTAADGESAAQQVALAAEEKSARIAGALDEQDGEIEQAVALATRRVAAVAQNPRVFDLSKIIKGWFNAVEAAGAQAQVILRARTNLTLESAAGYGTVPENIVNQFVNSAATEATARARMQIAQVLDQATGITRQVSEDDEINAEAVSEKAQKLLEVWKNVVILNITYERLFRKTLNRVTSYQKRLARVGADLAGKQVTLERISSSLVARQSLVKKTLFETCVSGIALGQILEREENVLERLQNESNASEDMPAQAFAQRLQEQEALIQIITKRLVDLKAFAIKLIGLYSVLGNTRMNVAIIKADVVFTRTNLMATLGLQLGLVVDILATLRISEAAKDLREAEADASEQVGVASEALNQAANSALLEVETTIRSLRATIEAAVSGIENTHQNMERVEEMNRRAEDQFSDLFEQLAV